MESDMKRISKEFDYAVFIVDMTDEEGRNSRWYWKNGKYYVVEAVFPEFDESKLGE